MTEETLQQPTFHTIPFQFKGDATEYFKIWIVNLFLSILTLGIFSAWAKVRRKRYFYGNTLLDNSSFEYLGDPIAILKGRLIAFVLFAIYAAASSLDSWMGFIFFLCFMVLFIFAFPWLIVRSLAFNAVNSSYRNIRFHFHGKYKEAFKTIIGWGVLIPFTLGLIYPFYIAKQKKFIVDHHAYGLERFHLKENIGGFYKAYLPVIILGALFIIVPMLLAVAIPAYMALSGKLPNQAIDQGFFFLIFVGFLVLFYTVFIALYAYLQARITNLVFNHTEFANNHFKSTLRARTMIWLYLSNIVAIICSFGLLTPWATIRVTRYRLQNLMLVTSSALDSFVTDTQKRVNAMGEEIGEMFDFDIAL